MSCWLGFIVLSGSIIFGSIGYLIGRPKGTCGLGFWLPRRTGRSGERSTASRPTPIAANIRRSAWRHIKHGSLCMLRTVITVGGKMRLAEDPAGATFAALACLGYAPLLLCRAREAPALTCTGYTSQGRFRDRRSGVTGQ
jgi:hypothetical protein